jgi:hypothetical protein
MKKAVQLAPHGQPLKVGDKNLAVLQRTLPSFQAPSSLS